jgi:hypothetical protein
MPIHIAPYFRNKEVAMEAAGLIVPINSDGYNAKVSAEKAGLSYKTVPLLTFNLNGKQSIAKE